VANLFVELMSTARRDKVVRMLTWRCHMHDSFTVNISAIASRVVWDYAISKSILDRKGTTMEHSRHLLLQTVNGCFSLFIPVF
jgi:hypothetical protein